jgi:hypothetical protein
MSGLSPGNRVIRGPGAGRSSSVSDPAHSPDTEKGAFREERPLFIWADQSALLGAFAVLIGTLAALLAILAAVLLLLLLAALFFVALLLLVGILVGHFLSPFRHAIMRVTWCQPAVPA